MEPRSIPPQGLEPFARNAYIAYCLSLNIPATEFENLPSVIRNGWIAMVKQVLIDLEAMESNDEIPNKP